MWVRVGGRWGGGMEMERVCPDVLDFWKSALKKSTQSRTAHRQYNSNDCYSNAFKTATHSVKGSVDGREPMELKRYKK